MLGEKERERTRARERERKGETRVAVHPFAKASSEETKEKRSGREGERENDFLSYHRLTA